MQGLKCCQQTLQSLARYSHSVQQAVRFPHFQNRFPSSNNPSAGSFHSVPVQSSMCTYFLGTYRRILVPSPLISPSILIDICFFTFTWATALMRAVHSIHLLWIPSEVPSEDVPLRRIKANKYHVEGHTRYTLVNVKGVPTYPR